jgi:hypothetical protein
MRYIPVVGLLVSCTLAISACVAERVTAIDESSAEHAPSAFAADADDPYGTCEYAPTEEYDDYVCSQGGVACDGITSLNVKEDGSIWGQFWRSCVHPCETASDCPVPITGNAEPQCTVGGVCRLFCGEGQSCPDGLACSVYNGGAARLDDGSISPTTICEQYTELDPYRPPPELFPEWL